MNLRTTLRIAAFLTAVSAVTGGWVLAQGSGEQPTAAPAPSAAPATAAATPATTSAGPTAAADPLDEEDAPTAQTVAATRTPSRPPPSPEQVEALRLLEGELDGFRARAEDYQRSVNGLLRREHDNQLASLRGGYERQIDIERQGESDARRRAIEVFENFVIRYPNERDHTPDVLFRLAELYYDEAQTQKLEADDRLDRERARREAAGLPTDDLAQAPVDYRCSVLLYRHVVQRFPAFRLRDASHYLLGWVLKEMGKEDEAVTAYRSLVCPSRFQYTPVMDLAAPIQGASLQMCQRVIEALSPYGPGMLTPPASTVPPDGLVNGTLTETTVASETEPQVIPTDYASCTPMNGANGRASRYAAEVWYYVGDYHFDNPPPRNSDLGTAYAIAAYQQSMRSSETPRIGLETPAGAGRSADNNVTVAQPAAARAQFRDDIEYGQFWSKALYKIGWGYFRMLNGYPRALESFSKLLDYFDFAGMDETARGTRTDTLKWIGVIFSESSWGSLINTDPLDCQPSVEEGAHPPADAQRPFECAGILRITSPYNVTDILRGAADANAAQRPTPVPGRPTYLPQDRPWTADAYLELAQDYFQQSKYFEAITLYRVFLRLYPMHHEAPRVTERIAIAYERQRQFEAGLNARDGFGRFVEGSPWYNANNEHPDAQRYAEVAAHNSLHDMAIQHHRRASDLRQRAIVLAGCSRGTNGGEVCQGQRPGTRQAQELEQQANQRNEQANQEYALAVQGYESFIRVYPNDDEAYEFRYNRADALYWSQKYAEAARAYAEVRDSNENDAHQAAAAYMAVKCAEQALVQLAQRHQLDPCLAIRAGLDEAQVVDEVSRQPLIPHANAVECAKAPEQPAQAGGQSSSDRLMAINVPEPVSQLMAARRAYTRRVSERQDTLQGLADVVTPDADAARNPPFRSKFDYLNARTLYRFGQGARAEREYKRLLTVFCQDATVSGAIYADLNNLYVVQGRLDAQTELNEQQSRNRCAGVDMDTVTVVLNDAAFRQALGIFHQAEQASGPDALRLYEQAARVLMDAINRNRNHPDAPQALFYAALAYERTNRFDTATQTYMRIVQDYNTLNVIGSNPPRPLAGDQLATRVKTLELSNFRAAFNLERTFDYDNAIRYFNNVVSDTRFANAEDHASHVHDALSSIAMIHTNLGHWTQARDAWRAFLPKAASEEERNLALWRQAEMPYRAQTWSEAVRSLRDYRRSVPMNSGTAAFHVRAQYEIAKATREQGDRNGYARELRAVADVYRQSGQQAGSAAAVFAAEALYPDLETRANAFDQRVLTQGTGEQLASQIRSMRTDLTAIDNQSTEISNLLGGEYTVGALVRRGQAHEHLAEQMARVASLFQLSRDQQRTLDSLEQNATRLEGAADQLDRVGRGEQAQQIRDQATGIRDQVQQRRDQMTQQLQEQYDNEAKTERKVAVIMYGVAIHLARRFHIPTQFAAQALEYMRREDNRGLIDEAMQEVPQELARTVGFSYTQGMFDTDAPGVTVLQDAPTATPGLVRE